MDKVLFKNNLNIDDSGKIFLLAVMGNLALQLVAGIILGAVNAFASLDLSKSIMTGLIFMLIIQLVYLSVYVLCVRKSKRTLAFAIYKNTPPIHYLIYFAIALLAILTFYAPTAWFMTLLEKIGYNADLNNLPTMTTVWDFIIGVPIIIILAPIVEELIFRGALMSGLKGNMSDTKIALLSALAFMLMHMNPNQTIYQFCLGFVCAIVVLRTGKLIAGIAIHAFNNLLALLMDYTPLIKPINSFYIFVTQSIWIAVIVSIIFFVCFGALQYVLIKYLTKPQLSTDVTGSDEVIIKPYTTFQEFDTQENEGELDSLSVPKQAPKPIDKHKREFFKIMYIGACLICSLIWMVAFFVSFM